MNRVIADCHNEINLEFKFYIVVEKTGLLFLKEVEVIHQKYA